MIWKAIILIFVLGGAQPGIMLGGFPDTFPTKADCTTFLEEKKGALSKAAQDVADEAGKATGELIAVKIDARCIGKERPGQPL